MPGTSAGDHLVSGLVPFALIALLGIGYRRSRHSVRAVVAGLLGIVGITGRNEAIHDFSRGAVATITPAFSIAAELALGCVLTVLCEVAMSAIGGGGAAPRPGHTLCYLALLHLCTSYVTTDVARD